MAYISQRRSSRVRFVRPVPLRPWAEGWRAPPVAPPCARLALKNGPPPARRPKVGSTLLKFLKRPQQSKTGSWSGSPRSSLGAPDYWRAIGVVWDFGDPVRSKASEYRPLSSAPTISQSSVPMFCTKCPHGSNWESRIGRRLKLRYLHVLSCVVDCGSMSKGAAQLGLS